MPAMSPRTQQLQAGMTAGPDQEVALFEQGFSEMAYNLLSSRMPDLMQDVVTFKVLDVDIDQGTGTGAFVVLRSGAPLYVPVVMCDNAIKPLEIFYHKASNVFLPLTKGWLDEIDKNALTALGGGVKTPETLYTDVDIRNVVVPPITGRFSYAAWMPKALVDVARVCTRQALELAEKVAGEAQRPLMFIHALEQAPNHTKAAFARMLEKNASVMQVMASTYTVPALIAALKPRATKVAAKQLTGGALWIADKDSTPSEFRRVFGDKAGEAFAGVKLKGYAARDTRTNRNRAVQEQPYAQWTEPTRPGIYTVYETNGKETPAFVMPTPVDIFLEGPKYGRKPAVPAHVAPADRVYPQGRPSEDEFRLRRPYDMFLVVFGDGSYTTTSNLVGSPSIADELSGPLHKRMFVDVDGSPRVGKGMFVRQKGTSFEATVPVEIKSITNDADGVRRMRVANAHGYNERTVSTDPKNAYGAIWMPKGSDIVYMPPDFLWVPLKERRDGKQLYTSALDLQACVSSALGSVGAKKVSIKDAGARQFSVNGERSMPRIAALKKLAYEMCLSVDDAETLLEKAASDGHVAAWAVSTTQLARAQMKLAADDGGDKKKSDSDKPKKKSPPSDGGGGGGGGDPGMEDPGLGEEAAMAAMAPPAPPPPQPLDLAAMEMDQAIQHEMQKLVEKQQTIQMLLQRSNEIAGGAPPAPSVQTQAMGAPPSSQNLATGGPGMPPGVTSGMGGGMDPSMGGDPSMMGGDPSMGMPVPPNTMDPTGGAMPPGSGMDPSMMGGAMPPGGGMDPSMMGGGGMPPGGGMDPSMGGGMPGAMMPPDGPNAMSLQQEVNPQFLQQAAQLHSTDMFDAAAVATLAQSPELHSIVATNLPNLEKAVDNLARVLLTLWMQEYELKPQIGEATYTGLEENLQSTFKGMGDLVLRLSRGVQAIKEPDDHAP